MSRPMPSPRCTNIEGLTMPGPAAAYDAALSDDTTTKLTDFLSDKITPEDMDTVLKIVAEDEEAAPAMAGDAKKYYATVREQYRKGHLNSREYESALMSPPPRPATAADEARFAALFPNMKRLKGL